MSHTDSSSANDKEENSTIYNAENAQMSSGNDSDHADDFVQIEHSCSDSDSSEDNLEPDNHFGMSNKEFKTAIASFCVNSKLKS